MKPDNEAAPKEKKKKKTKVELDTARTIHVPGQVVEATVKVSLDQENADVGGGGGGEELENSDAMTAAAEDTQPSSSSSAIHAENGNGTARADPCGGAGVQSKAREEIRFELICLEKVDPALVGVRVRDYDSASTSLKTRKKIERVIGRSEKVCRPLALTSEESEKEFSLYMDVPEGFPPTYTGVSVSYAYKLRCSTVRVIPSKSGNSVREIEKSSTSFPLCFWSGQKTTRHVGSSSTEEEACFVLTVVGSDQGSGNKHLSASPVKRRDSSAPHHHRRTSQQRDSDHAPTSPQLDDTLPDFMTLRRRPSSSRDIDVEELLFGGASQTYNIFCHDTCFVHLHVLGLSGNGNVTQPGCLMECVLDFLPTDLYTCSKVSVELVVTEILLKPKQAKMKQFTKQVFENSDITLHCSRTTFTFNVPRDSHPSIESDLVKLEWELQFTFQVLCSNSAGAAYSQAVPQVLNWKLPMQMSLDL